MCARLADLARDRGLRVAGILSVGAPDDPSGRQSRVVLDLSTGDSRPLGRRAGGERGRHWNLDEGALAWGADAARAGAAGADVLIIDELGRLELGEGRGWVSCLDLLLEPRPRLAVASVREEYLPAFRARLGPLAADLEVAAVNETNRDQLPGCLLGEDA